MKKTLIDINNKFNTISIKYTFISKIDKSKVTSLNILSRVLLESSNKYRSFRSIEEKLEEFYGAMLYADAYKFDTFNFAVEFMIEFIDPKLINDENYKFSDVFDFFKSIIYDPYIKNSKFNLKALRDSKNNLYYKLKENESIYSSLVRKKLNNIIYESDLDKIPSNGYLKDIYKINSKNLVDTYHEMLSSDLIISISGDLNKEELELIDIYNDDIKYDFYNYNVRSNYKSVTFKKSIESSYLEIAYNLKAYMNKDRYYETLVFNNIFAKENYSLLFMTLREKLGLCYSVSSRYYSNTGLIILTINFDYTNYSNILFNINKILNDLKNGNFSDDLIKMSKQTLIDNINSSLDNNDLEIYKRVMKEIYNIDYDYNTFIKKVLNVRKEDIVKLVKDIKEVGSVYLCGDGNEF